MKPRQYLLLFLVLALAWPQLSAQPDPAMPGVVVARESGGFLALTLVDYGLVLRFYDASKTQIQPDAPRAMAFWRFRTDRNRLPLTLEGDTLISPQRVHPPYAFNINISLLTMEDNDVTESYNFDMRYFQTPAPATEDE